MKKIKRLKKLIKIWFKVSMLAAQSQLLTSWAGILFIFGKVFRFLFFFIFLYIILTGVNNLAGYSTQQVIFFFLIFNLIDILTQFLFRGTYQFRFSVVRGEFDLDLLKPWPSFFRPVFGWTDILDFITLIPLVAYIIYFSLVNSLSGGALSIILFLLLFVNAILISFAFHLTVCGVGILTLEIDHLIWVYRDLSNMARFPTDIYPKAIQYLLTFTIPVVILFTVPVKAFLGGLSLFWLFLSFLIGALSFWASLKFWHYALKNYSSASS